ncbi:hypothetical protein AB7W80_11930 [Providencia rettgeri]|uniref:hypothetical protein n=1 Tax=Providencia sp. CIM-Carb-044 TaxID=3096048 RepID=UPI0029D9C7A0|nr:hypothetical protein [Providencia sp. CIM-Carb-044]MDX7425546.1 hypothetical protein [Providencia sp. CIM-Carb-044]
MHSSSISKKQFIIPNLIFYISTLLIISKKYSSLFDYPEITKSLLAANILILFTGLFFQSLKKIEIALLIASSITYITTLNPEFIILVLYLLNSKKISKEKYINLIFIISFLYFLAIVLLNHLNILPSQDIHYRLIDNIKENRDDLGFKNPNSVFLYFTPIALCYIYKRFERWNYIDTMLYIAVIYIIYSISLSRTGLAVNSISLISIYLIKLIPNAMSLLTKNSILIFSFITLIIAVYFYDDYILNYALSNRPYIWNSYLSNELSFQSVIGQPLEDKENLLPLDNSYIPLLIYHGFFYIIFIFYLYLTGLNKKKIEPQVFILSFYILCYSLFENVLFNLEFNITLVLLYLSIRNNKK